MSLLLVSDDNFKAVQVTRVLALTARIQPSGRRG